MPKKTAYRICDPADGAVRMHRLFARIDSRFVPVGWNCPDCQRIQKE